MSRYYAFTRAGFTIQQVQDLVSLNTTELTGLDGITPGTVTASKALVVDSNKDLTSLRNLTVTNLDAGASGTAGSVDIFPSTASKGKVSITATDNAGNTTTALTFGAFAAARTLNVSDPLRTSTVMFYGGTVTDAGPMTATGGCLGEVVSNTSDSKLYLCTTAHATAATWAALN